MANEYNDFSQQPTKEIMMAMKRVGLHIDGTGGPIFIQTGISQFWCTILSQSETVIEGERIDTCAKICLTSVKIKKYSNGRKSGSAMLDS